MKTLAKERQTDIKYDIAWTSLGEYLEHLQIARHRAERRVASSAPPRRASTCSAKSTRSAPTRSSSRCRRIVRTGDGGRRARRRCVAHLRAGHVRGDRRTRGDLVPKPRAAAARTSRTCAAKAIACSKRWTRRSTIARRAQIPVEIYHLKAAGKSNWDKIDAGDRAHRQGARRKVCASPPTCTRTPRARPASTPRCRPGCRTADTKPGCKRLKDPKIRARVIAEMRAPGRDWENLLFAAGSADNMLLIGFKTDKLKPLTGKRLSEVAKMRGKSPEDTAIDLVIEDGTRIETRVFPDVRRQRAQADQAAVHEFRIGCRIVGAGRRVPAIEHAPARVRQLRAACSAVTCAMKTHLAAGGRAPSHVVARGQSRAQATVAC